jgi:N-carbamoyl-L-amino-acid hydrolase
MEEAGLSTSTDGGANLIGRREGRLPDLPPIVLGSHTDTVAGGGRFDGVIGVLGAIEVAQCLEGSQVELDHPLEVVDFLGEEPNDFGLSMVGSRVLAGTLDGRALARQNPDGQTLGEAIASMGGNPAEIGHSRRPRGSIGAYLELHIEQGPVLEAAACPVGVVSTITGVTRFLVRVDGRIDHAGGMPMGLRKDALAAAAEVVLAVENLWRDGAGVGTIGRILVSPNAINVIPGQVELLTDMRSVERDVLARRRDAWPPTVSAIGDRRGVQATVDLLSHEDPVPIGEGMQSLLETAARDAGIHPLRLPSFAGHDANQMAKLAPTGMVFVPSRGGRSHCPEEWSEMADVARGVEVLGRAVLRLDAEGFGADELTL